MVCLKRGCKNNKYLSPEQILMQHYLQKWKRVKNYDIDRQEEYAGTLLHNGSLFIKKISQIKVSTTSFFLIFVPFLE